MKELIIEEINKAVDDLNKDGILCYFDEVTLKIINND